MYPKVSDKAKDSVPPAQGPGQRHSPERGNDGGRRRGRTWAVAGGRMGRDVGKLRVWAGDQPLKGKEQWNWVGSDRRRAELWMWVVGDRRKAEQWMLATVC